jgi:uncharacterized protein
MIYFSLFKSSNNQQWYFNIRSAAGKQEVLAASEGYHNKQDALHTINVIRRGATTARIYDFSTQQWAA